MNRNQLYSRVITALIYNRIILHSLTGDIFHYGDYYRNAGIYSKLDIFEYRDYYSLYTFDAKHIIIHKYVK